MKTLLENNVLTLQLEGRIDTSNVEEVEKEITEARTSAHTNLVLDFEKVTYISSAGLRIILRLKKAEKQLSIINVSSDVYEILDMTGFTEMIDVKKAYRVISIEGCEVIGEGSNGIVYRYTPDIIVKVYKNSDALPDIHRERELARTALVLGVNTAIPYDVVKVDDKYGSVFELLSAKSISKLILTNPEHKDEYIKIFTDMLKTIHETEVKPGVLPDIKKTYLNYALFLKDYLDEKYYSKLVSLIEAVEDKNTMIHGDYHTNNVHYANNEAILIDMDTLSCGDPIFEFASVYMGYKGFNEIDPTSSINFLKMNSVLCNEVFTKLVQNYFNVEDITPFEDKFRVLCYTRLLRRTLRRDKDNVEAINYLKTNLEQLIDKVDTLRL